MSQLNRLEQIIRDRANQQDVANRCDFAYLQGLGNPESFQSFTFEEQPVHGVRNLVGLAVMASGLGMWRKCRCDQRSVAPASWLLHRSNASGFQSFFVDDQGGILSSNRLEVLSGFCFYAFAELAI